MRPALLTGLLVVLAAAGCGDGNQTASRGPTTTAPATGPAATTTTAAASTTTSSERPISLELFFLAPDGQLVADMRTIDHTLTPGAASLRELTNPPDGATTQVPDGLALTIDSGRANVTGPSMNKAAEAQVVYTLTSFSTVRSVNGETRRDVEAFAPPILVEHPTAGESVRSPVHVSGSANTFEATFNYSLRDAQGHELAHDVVTATSGSGERGTFEFTAAFSVDTAQTGTLAVFELSAENGAVVHERDVPLRLLP